MVWPAILAALELRVLQQAEQETARLNRMTHKVVQGDERISELRKNVADFPGILPWARLIGIEEGFRITGGVNSGALSTSMEWDMGFDRKRVHVYPLYPEMASNLLGPDTRESINQAVADVRRYDPEGINFVIVTQDDTQIDRLSVGSEEITVISIFQFPQYLINLKASTIPKMRCA